jgi:hypothetical protein
VSDVDEQSQKAFAAAMALSGRIAQLDEMMEVLARRRVQLVLARAELMQSVEPPKEGNLNDDERQRN